MSLFIRAREDGGIAPMMFMRDAYHPDLQPMIEFAKANNLWEPPKRRLTGREAIHAAWTLSRGKPASVNFTIDPDKCPSDEGNYYPCHTFVASEYLRMVKRSDYVEENKQVFRDRIWIDVPEENTKDGSTMYLSEALAYLDGYGKDPEKCRVVAHVSTRPGEWGADLDFQWMRGDDITHKWKTEMVGGLVFFPEVDGWGHKRDPKHVGWSVHS